VCVRYLLLVESPFDLVFLIAFIIIYPKKKRKSLKSLIEFDFFTQRLEHFIQAQYILMNKSFMAYDQLLISVTFPIFPFDSFF